VTADHNGNSLYLSAVERCIFRQRFSQTNSKRINIYLVRVMIALEKLRSHPMWCSDPFRDRNFGLGQKSGNPKIADPRQAIVMDQNIERFQIVMHNILLMERHHATHNSEDNPELVVCIQLRGTRRMPDGVKKRATRNKFCQAVNVIGATGSEVFTVHFMLSQNVLKNVWKIV
jgi:hypothetical protein